MRVGFLVVVARVPRASVLHLDNGSASAAAARPALRRRRPRARSPRRSRSQYPSRVPGTEGAAEAARWYRETVGSLGLQTEEDVWTEDLADLGAVELRNVVTVVPGRSEQTIVLVAHRDNAGAEEPLGENASGTATLIELARGFAPQELGPDPLPQRTLVLVSTDAGAFGGAGAARFVDDVAAGRSAIAVVVLDDLGRGRPTAGDRRRRARVARAHPRSDSSRADRGRGRRQPALPSVPTQLVDLGMPFALGEQGRFLAAGLSAITLTTDGASTAPIAGPTPAAERLGQLGRATEALVSSLDTSVGGAFRTPDSLFFAGRAASGWTARLALILSCRPVRARASST